ncbi:DUF4233 domain-containing protein [Actinocorallia sp. A-T 12471]|uniref:DUF4233 domain-containing protein n=1 Tax=Actinocorallia sp. A-T 12471 TaxID=3089813 RepID=UPI0029CE396C|nr:DUF4233 domain-containing protein [Actinocorallia sp. A-T 12471]MDX6742953.1 DUF4233 domain-containing protein [Actinocorallia sp. A-T 12471]
MRRMLATILTFEALLLGLAIPVAISVGGMDAKVAGIGGGVLAVLSLTLAGTLGRRWGVAAATVFQAVVIALGFVESSMFIIGVLFAALWGYAIWLGRKFEGRPVG